MNERVTIIDLINLLATKHGMTEQDAEAFVKEFFLLIEQTLESDKCVKIKGLGTFKLIEVDNRESVNINTGERFQIKGHNKVTFIPDTNIKDTINKPFAHFETVTLNENAILEDTPLENDEEEEGAESEGDRRGKGISENMEEERNLKDNSDEQFFGNKIEGESSSFISIPEDKSQEQSEIPQVNSVKKDVASGNKSPFSLLITLIIIVLSLCGGIVFYVYYPDILSSSSQQDGIEMPIQSIRPTQVDTEMLDSVKKDTAQFLPTKIRVKDSIKQNRAIVEKESVSNIPVMEGKKKTSKQNATRVYSASVAYTITGTKATHTIKKGETLIKVSMRYYGNEDMWIYIVRYNRGTIKNPDNVPYGTIIKIPELTEKQK